MNNTSKIVLLGLLAAAVFVIFNCAGYLAITLLLPQSVSSDGAAGDSAEMEPGAVVSFTTATPAPLLNANGEIPTPAPLLPTITPGGAPPTPDSPPAAPPTRTPLTPVQTSPQVTAAPGDLAVVSHQSYIDSLGWYHIVGEVQNNASTSMEYVEVIAKLYNSEKEVIGTKLTFTAPDVIAPGAAPFDIIALRQAQWENIESYSLEVKGDVSDSAAPQDLILLSQSGQIENDLLVVGGQVQNVGNAPVLAKLIVTLYDADLNVINTSWSYADEGIIPANGVSGFEVKVLHKTDPNNFSYRIQIEEEAVND